MQRIRQRFGIARVALVGDRGMLTTARIRKGLQPAGLDWISASRSRDLRKLVAAPGQAGTAAPVEPGRWSRTPLPRSPARTRKPGGRLGLSRPPHARD